MTAAAGNTRRLRADPPAINLGIANRSAGGNVGQPANNGLARHDRSRRQYPALAGGPTGHQPGHSQPFGRWQRRASGYRRRGDVFAGVLAANWPRNPGFAGRSDCAHCGGPALRVRQWIPPARRRICRGPCCELAAQPRLRRPQRLRARYNRTTRGSNQLRQPVGGDQNRRKAGSSIVLAYIGSVAHAAAIQPHDTRVKPAATARRWRPKQEKGRLINSFGVPGSPGARVQASQKSPAGLDLGHHLAGATGRMPRRVARWGSAAGSPGARVQASQKSPAGLDLGHHLAGATGRMPRPRGPAQSNQRRRPRYPRRRPGTRRLCRAGNHGHPTTEHQPIPRGPAQSNQRRRPRYPRRRPGTRRLCRAGNHGHPPWLVAFAERSRFFEVFSSSNVRAQANSASS